MLAAETREIAPYLWVHPGRERGEGAEIVVRRRHFTHVRDAFRAGESLVENIKRQSLYFGPP